MRAQDLSMDAVAGGNTASYLSSGRAEQKRRSAIEYFQSPSKSFLLESWAWGKDDPLWERFYHRYDLHHTIFCRNLH